MLFNVNYINCKSTTEYFKYISYLVTEDNTDLIIVFDNGIEESHTFIDIEINVYSKKQKLVIKYENSNNVILFNLITSQIFLN